jgi:hypothetical protein
MPLTVDSIQVHFEEEKMFNFVLKCNASQQMA